MRFNSQIRKLLFVTATLSFSFLLVDCGGSNSNTTQSAVVVTASFASIYSGILSQSCAQCHVPGAPAHDLNGVVLNFSSASAAYSTLKSSNVSGMSSTGTCGGIHIIGSDSSHSYLAGVLFADYNTNNFAGVSGCQPYANHISDQHITSAQEAAIVQWINAGAPNN